MAGMGIRIEGVDLPGTCCRRGPGPAGGFKGNPLCASVRPPLIECPAAVQ